MQHEEPLFLSATQEHSGDAVQPNFFSQKVLEKGQAKELCYFGYTKENGIKERGLLVEDSIKAEDEQRCTLVNPLDKNPDHNFGWPTLDVLPRRDLDMERVQEEKFQFFQTLNGCVICFDTISQIMLHKGCS